MSFETQITQLVATLTARLNTIAEQAKKIFELDWQNPLITSSEIHVSNAGTSQKINVQQIIDAAVSFRQNQLISVGDITVSGNTVTVPSGAKWIIDNVNYETITDTVINIPFATAGYNRKDILVAGKEGTIYVVQGFESEEISIPRNPPIDTVLVTTIDINDSSVGDPSDPSYGTDFVEKRESATIDVFTYAPINDVIYASDQRSFMVISGVATDIKSIAVNVTYGRDGKPFFIKNKTDHNIKLWHNAAGMVNKKFYFPNEQDFILKPNEIAQFTYNISIGRIEYVGLTGFQEISNQIEVSGNQTISNLWHGKTVIFTSSGTLTVPASLLPSFIFNGITLPSVTITLAITTPKTWLFGTPIPITEKQIFTLTQRGSTNSIMLLPVQ